MTGTERAAARRALGEMLDAYGADPARWPAGDPRRAAAWALLDSGDATQSATAAGALDRALERALERAPAPSAALTGAVLQAAPRPGLRARAGARLALFKPVGALACAMLLGIAVGVWSPVPIAGESRAAGPETELALFDTLEDNGDDSRFGDFAR